MEEISDILSDTSKEIWADQIRLMKEKELDGLILKKKTELISYRESIPNNPQDDGTKHKFYIGILLDFLLLRLRRNKLKFLK